MTETRKTGGTAAGRNGGRGEALEAVFDETIALFFRLRAVVEVLHGQGEGTSGRRAVLRELDKEGAKTVPQMARARPVSRQSMQATVNGLADDGLVEFAHNPAHKRSKLVQLTSRGKELLGEMDRREAEALDGLGIEVPEGELRQAAEVLAAVRETFEGEQAQRLLESGVGAAAKGEERDEDG